MAKPQQSTLDRWLATFAGWNEEDRSAALLHAEDCHKWTTAAERRLKAPKDNQETLTLVEGQTK